MPTNVLIDTTTEYDENRIKYLLDLWEKIILSISNQVDHNKILIFLQKVGIIDINEDKKEVVIWAANDFILSQIKKNLSKPLKEAIQQCYNSQFWVRFVVFTPFTDWDHPLLTDLKKLLNITDNTSNKNKQNNVLETSLKEELSRYFWNLFDPKFRFDTFIAWSNNQFAFSAAKAVAQAPWTQNNPLFLYWNVGLGKTHLMQAIWNDIMENFPDKVVIYLPATKLIDELIQALRANKLPTLQKKFDQVDVLLVDDIQFLADKERTQEVFHDLFNDFYTKKKQVILSSDRPPRELTRIAPRLQSRFATWLVADIQAPDFETRIAILESKIQSKDVNIDFECLSLIAQYIKSNVRELEGALNILISRQQITNSEITENDVYSCLKTLGYYVEQTPWITNPNDTIRKGSKTSTKNFETLIEMLASYYDLAVADIKSESRKKPIAQARQMLMYLAREYFWWTYEQIWDYFKMNHATAMYATDKIEKALKNDSRLQHDYRVFSDWIQQ